MDRNKIDIIQVIPTLGIGGAEIIVENLSKGFLKLGKNVLVISLYNQDTIISERLKSANIPMILLDKKSGFDISIIYKLVKIFKLYKPSVVHSHTYATLYSIPAALIAGVRRKVHTVHNIANKEIGFLNRIVYKIYYTFFNLIPVTISEEIKHSFIKEYKMKSTKVEMIYNGIELSSFSAKETYDINKDIFTLTHVGSFKPQKNHSFIIDVFNNLINYIPNAQLNLIGDGTLKKEIEKKVENYKIINQVNFIGEIENVNEFLIETDIFILLSLWEGMPISIIEAMASALPIISTDVGGIRDMVKNNYSGVLVEQDIEEITNEILKLYSSKKIREEYGRNARVKSIEYSNQSMCKNYARVYEL